MENSRMKKSTTVLYVVLVAGFLLKLASVSALGLHIESLPESTLILFLHGYFV